MGRAGLGGDGAERRVCWSGVAGVGAGTWVKSLHAAAMSESRLPACVCARARAALLLRDGKVLRRG